MSSCTADGRREKLENIIAVAGEKKKIEKKKKKKCKKEQIKNIIHCTFMSTRVYLNRKDRGTRRRDAEYVILSAARDYDDVFFPRGLFSLVHLATKSHEITSETRKQSYVRANVKSTTAKKKNGRNRIVNPLLRGRVSTIFGVFG